MVAFNRLPQLLVDWSRADAVALKNLEALPLKGNTAFYDACYFGIEKLKQSKRFKRVLLIVSDGQDNVSQYRYKDIERAVKESGVLVYAVSLAPLDPYFVDSGSEVLSKLARMSGGSAFNVSDKRQIGGVFDLFATELRSQYTLGFKVPTDFTIDNKWHRLELKLVVPSDVKGELKDVQVRTRAGYYGVANLR